MSPRGRVGRELPPRAQPLALVLGLLRRPSRGAQGGVPRGRGLAAPRAWGPRAPALYGCPGARRARWGALPCPPLAPGRVPAPARCAWRWLQREEAARGRRSLSGRVCEVVRKRRAVLIRVFLHCSHLPLAISGLGRTPAEFAFLLRAPQPGRRRARAGGRALPASTPGKSPAPAQCCARLACSSCSISSEGTFTLTPRLFSPPVH